MARHGLDGQLGVPSELSVPRPNSVMRAEAVAGTSRAAVAAKATASMGRWRRVIGPLNTSDRSRLRPRRPYVNRLIARSERRLLLSAPCPQLPPRKRPLPPP